MAKKNDFTWRGLFIYDCATQEEAEAYVKQIQPQAGVLFMISFPGMGTFWKKKSFKPGKPEKKEWDT